MAETIVLLHGFGGTHRAWDRLIARLDPERYRPLAVELRGHGAARDARPIGFVECTADVLATAPERFALCGYSMGGRIAQHVALAAPARVTRLVLVSTTAALGGYSGGGGTPPPAAPAPPGRVTRLVLVSTTAGIDDPLERTDRLSSDAE